MEAAGPERIGQRSLDTLQDHDWIAGTHALEELEHGCVRHPHAAVRCGLAQGRLVVGAVDVEVALERVAPGPAVHAVLGAFERQHPGQDEILIARLAAPQRAGGHAALEHGARRLA